MNDSVTITAALSELKTIEKRLDKKRNFVINNSTRSTKLVDPNADSVDGGTKTLVERELQAIKDLEERKIKIRSGINRVNMETIVNIEGEERSISDWLTWRREVQAPKSSFMLRVNQHLTPSPRHYDAEDTGIVTNIGSDDWLGQMEKLDKIVGGLDAALSIKNATTVIPGLPVLTD